MKGQEELNSSANLRFISFVLSIPHIMTLFVIPQNSYVTVYPEMLVIIKFGDLRKIRLSFNIGRN